MTLQALTSDSGAMVCVIVSIGMGLAFLIADAKSSTTRMLVAFLVLIGWSIFFNVSFVRPSLNGEILWASHLAPIMTAGSLIFGAEWVLRIRRMVPAGNLRTRFGDAQFRLAQVLGFIYGLLGVLENELRITAFIAVSEDFSLASESDFWLFAAPMGLSVLFIVDGILITLNRKPEPPEKKRLLGIAAASPLIGAGLLLPAPYASFSSAVGQMIFLIAAVQYHVMQGQRGQFLKQFLSPAVADLVRKHGLAGMQQQTKMPVAAVACDLRGYTDYSASRDSAEVLELLQLFYDAVGKEASEHGATIKDYAGDGVLLLLGAPLPLEGHAEKAVLLAQHIRQRCGALFAERGIDLGLGIGVASGQVSVGVIGQTRLEYVAVGQAVNLAARLCQNAAAGEILLDQATRQALPPESTAQTGDAMQLKGFAEPVPTWLVPA